MWKGCLLLLVLLSVTLFLEHRSVSERGLPLPWVAAGVLSMGATLLLGSFYGLIEALLKRRNPETDPSRWIDGQTIRVSGRVHATGQPCQAPFSGKSAVLVLYQMTQGPTANALAGLHNSVPRVSGFEMVPCAVTTRHGTLQLRGVPPLQPFLPGIYRDDTKHASAASVLASARWQLASFAQPLEHFIASGTLRPPQYVINRLAAESLFAPTGGFSARGGDSGAALECTGDQAAGVLALRLRANGWWYQERFIPHGEELTAEGTYSANPPSIDIGTSVLTPNHKLSPGAAELTASREWLQALAFVLIFGTIVASLHYAVFADGGALYRSIVRVLLES